MAKTQKSMKALKSIKGLKSVKQIKGKATRGAKASLPTVSFEAIAPKKLLRKVSGAKVKKSLPWLAAGLAVGVGAYFANRAVKNQGGYKSVAKTITEKIPSKWTAWATGATEEVSSAAAELNKPYPVNSTSKKHSRTRMQMRDTQKITQV